MTQSSAKLFKQYLRKENISPQAFAQRSGMPETEVRGILNGELSITNLRAYHLAIAFDTDVEMWVHKNSEQAGKNPHRIPKRPSLVGSD